MRESVAIALGSVLAASGVVAGFARVASATPRQVPVRLARVVVLEAAKDFVPAVMPEPRNATWAPGLASIEVRNRNTNARGSVRLYRDDGTVDVVASRTFMSLCASVLEAREPLAPRLVQLAVRASYHFGGKPIIVVSATRRGARGKHAHGDALDFQIEGVSASTLAAYLRSTPRAGVGIYTNPKTQYVHLDVRERSYHWIDASPPGVSWRERLLRDPSQAKRDESYVGSMDLPEAATK